MIPFDPGDLWSYTGDGGSEPEVSTFGATEIRHARRRRVRGGLFLFFLLAIAPEVLSGLG